MFKALIFVVLVGLQGAVCAMASEYNPDLFKMNKEEHVGKIIKERQITETEISESLAFLSPPAQKQPLSTQYNNDHYKALLSEGKSINPHNKALQNYLNDCSRIYFGATEVPFRQEAVYRLLKAVTTELKEHYIDLQEMRKVLHPNVANQETSAGSNDIEDAASLKTSPNTPHKTYSNSEKPPVLAVDPVK